MKTILLLSLIGAIMTYCACQNAIVSLESQGGHFNQKLECIERGYEKC